MDFELRTQGSTLLDIPYWACGSHCTALEHSHVRTASNIFARRVLKGCLGEIPHMWTSSDGRSTDGRLRRLGNQLTIFMCRRFHSLTSDIMGGSLTGPNQGLLSSNLKGLDETMKSSTVRGSGLLGYAIVLALVFVGLLIIWPMWGPAMAAAWFVLLIVLGATVFVARRMYHAKHV